MINTRKVVVVGTGFVGMSFAYSIVNQGGINELVLIDVQKEKAEGEAMDLAHGISCAPNRINIKAGDYSECENADIAIITAGANQKPGQTRLELATENAKIIKEITENVINNKFKGIFIVASNPVDIMTYVVSKVSKFPRNKVIGSGTVLDTARLRYMIGEYIGITSKNVHAYIMGEHGDSSFVPWTHCYIGCKKIQELLEERNINMNILDEIYTRVQQAAYEVIEKKKATYYAIGLSLTKLVKTILNNENEILTVSTKLDGEYNHRGLFIGVPAIINNDGMREILELKLSKEEQEKFDNSWNILEETIKTNIDPIL